MSKSTTTKYTASDAKNNFGALMDAAQRAPVRIEKHGRTVAFLVSKEDMERLEDSELGARAMAVIRSGKSLGVKKSEAFLKKILHGAKN